LATLLVIVLVGWSTNRASAAGTALFNQPFHDNTVDGALGSVVLPTTPSATNAACLTASGNPTKNPLASCLTSTDAPGSGTLRLTSAATNQEGGVFASDSVPTSQALDVTFNSYQYGGNNADGIAFVVAATDPANPAPPASMGYSGGALGYSSNYAYYTAKNQTPIVPGLSHGYIGVGFDSYGNFSNLYEGSGCTDPPNIAGPMAGEVVVRGPGNGTVGYCALQSSAATATSQKLALHATTRAGSEIPVEVVINPTSSAVTTASGLAIPAGDYDVTFTPIGGTRRSMVGALPVVPSGLYPASWVTTAGIPKQLAFGWVASTGASTDFHEIDAAVVTSSNPVPQLAVMQTSYAAATLPAGSPVTYGVTASASGATETQPVTVTETLPAGILPVGASGVGWVCGAPSGQQISCTNSTNPFTSGSITVNGVVDSSGVTAAIVQSSTSAVATSGDGNAGTSSSAPAGTIPTAPTVLLLNPTGGPAAGGGDVTVTGSNLAGATAIEIGTTAEFAAGTPLTEVLCQVSAPGCFTVTSPTSLDISSMPPHVLAVATVKVVSLGIAGTGTYAYAVGPVLNFAAPPSGEINTAYSDQLTEQGGTGPFTWSVVGTIPPGLTLGSTTGLLSGTPTAAAVGTNSFAVKVTDSTLQSDAKAVNLSIIAGPALAFAAPPAAWTNTVYLDTLTESGGTAPFTWSLASGSPPAGISLSPDGNLTGTPTATGTSSFTVNVTDANSQSATEAATITVGTGVTASGTPPRADVNKPYSFALTATGGTAPYTWSLNSGILPAGVTLSPGGVLAGTPTASGTSAFSVNVVDANGGISTLSVSLVVAVPVNLAFTPNLADLNADYTLTLTATGGTTPYTWSTTSLPAGLSLDPSTGKITGKPTALGTTSFTATVTDSYGQIATESSSITVVGPPVVVAPTPPLGEVGAAYSYQLAATGGTTPYVWTVSSGTLPGGLTITSGGLISGTPTSAAATTFTVKVADFHSQTSTHTATITVAAAPSLAFGAPPVGEVGAAYSDQLSVSGGTAPFAWSVSSGALPAGLALSASTGLLSGTPTAAGSSSFTVAVSDAFSEVASQATSISVVGDPVLVFAAPPGGEVGVTYSDQLTASGGMGSYTWSTTGSLPGGVTLSASTGLLSGTPTAAGTFGFTVKVTDSAGQSASEGASVVVAADPLLGFALPPSGEVGVAYSDQLTESGGTGPFTWSVTAGGLPGGVTLGASTGLLSGTPSAAGSFSFTITLTDHDNQVVTQSASIGVVGDPALVFAAPPPGEVGVGYSDQLTASGGTGTYTWAVASGLPPGLTLGASTGLLSGTPTSAGTFPFSVTVTDSAGQVATEATSVTVAADPLLGFAAPPAGEVGVAYSDQLTESGGTAPFAWVVSAGSLPGGLSLSASTGLISGTPTAAVSTGFTITLTDRDGQVVMQPASISVVSGPVLAFAAPPVGEVGAAYSDQLAASGGTGAYAWSTSGTLPGGLTLSTSTGLLSGTPTAAGAFNFTVTVTDAPGQSASEGVSLTVAAAPSLAFGAPPVGEVGAAYSDQLSVSGGTGPFAWSVSSGALPAGLALSASTGLLSGTPTAAGSSSFTVAVSDAFSEVATQATSISVVGDPVLVFAAPPGGEVGVAYSDQLTASGGTGSYAWSTTGSLPGGVTLSASTGLLSGTPTAAGAFNFTVIVTDAAGQSASEAASVGVVAGPVLAFGQPPAGRLGSPYSDQLAASGGTTPYSWSVTAGGLPSGVTLGASTGLLSGTPTAGGVFNFTVTLTDQAGQIATEATSLDVTASISISPSVAPEGVITNGTGAAYGPLTLTAGGLASACTASPCSWSVMPSLPPGLTLSNPNSASAAITGTPTAVQTAVVTVTVSQGGAAQATFPLTISDIENLTTGIGAYPTAMVADPQNARVYVAASKSNQVDAINATANPITAVPTLTALGTSVLHFPDGLAYNSSSNALLASDYGSTSAAHVSPPSTGTPHSDSLLGCGEETGISEDSGSSDVWVGCAGNGVNGKVAVMTPAGVSVGLFTLAAGSSSPGGVAPTGRSGHVAIADAATGRLYTVTSTGSVGTAAVLPTGSSPANVAYASVGGTPFDYVADPGTGQFSIVNETADTAPVVAANVNLPAAVNRPQPYGIATNGSVLVVSDANNASAYVYALSGSAPFATLLYTIALPSSGVPDGVADLTVAGTNLAFIGNEGGNTVTVIDPPLANAKGKLKIPAAPIHLGLIGRRIGHPLPVSPRERVRSGHDLYPGPK
jgi:hypothetical protein